MNRRIKTIAISGILMTSLVLPLADFGSSKLVASAQTRTIYGRNWDWRDRDHRDRDHRELFGRKFYGRVYMKHGNRMYHRNKFFRPVIRRDSRFFYPKRIIVIDRNDSRNYIRLSNYLTGPNSYNANYVIVRTNSDFFHRFRSNIDITNDIDLDVNTGNNTVSMNTIVGNISTGDVDIDIR